MTMTPILQQSETVGTTELIGMVGCSSRQINYWIKNGCVKATVDADGPGTRRRFDLKSVLQFRALYLYGQSMSYDRTHFTNQLLASVDLASVDDLLTGFGLDNGRVKMVLNLELSVEEGQLREWIADQTLTIT